MEHLEQIVGHLPEASGVDIEASGGEPTFWVDAHRCRASGAQRGRRPSGRARQCRVAFGCLWALPSTLSCRTPTAPEWPSTSSCRLPGA